MARVLYRLAAWCADHPWRVAATWVLVLVLGGFLTVTGMQFSDGAFEIPGTDSARAQQILEDEFPATGGETEKLELVFQVPDGSVTDPEPAATIANAVAAASQIEHVVSVSDPLSTTAPTISPNGQVAIATVTFQGLDDDTELEERLTDEVEAIAAEARASGMTVEVGNSLVGVESSSLGSPSELLGVAIAFLVLLVTFGSLAAAGANMLTALVGVAAGLLGVFAFSSISPIGATTPILAVMLGLAVGIDYALFILSRFRDELRAGRSVREAVPMALGTAGSAVVFAGLTVIIALVGLIVVNIPFITEMGMAAAAGVAVAVIVALTVLPVLLQLLGHRALSRRERRAMQSTGAVVVADDAAPRIGIFERWAAAITRRPIVSLVAATTMLAVIAIPVLSMDTALSMPGGDDPNSSQRRAYEIVSDSFGAGYQSPLVVLVQSPDASTEASTVASAITELEHVAAVSPAQPNAGNTAAIISVTSTGGPTDASTADLVHEIRSSTGDVTDATVSVTGSTAVDIDVDSKLGTALIQYIVVIVVLAMVLLIVLFRSLLVPAIAALGFLLSLAAGFGAMVAVYQWGWLGGVFNVTEQAPILSLLPIIIVGILFGLAMDYQVFLVSRIHEAHVRGLSTTEAIKDGFGRAALVVAAAAAIMGSVFFGFGASGSNLVGSLAFALTVGVLVDAFVVRMIIVPAALTLLGTSAWWIPNWLDRLLPTIDTEGRTLEGDHGHDPRSTKQVTMRPITP